MRFGKIDLNPQVNPAILDTATWDEAGVVRILSVEEQGYWTLLREKLESGTVLPTSKRIQPYLGSVAQSASTHFCLAGLPDGQYVFLEIGTRVGMAKPGTPLVNIQLDQGYFLKAYSTSAATIDYYCQSLRPDKGPRVLGEQPRLGIGTRMSAAMLPGSYRAMHIGGIVANPIQNSVRELELLDNILAGRTPDAIYYPGFGTIESGHTGSTFEGLWVYGVLEALKSEGRPVYGADADHIKIADGADGLGHAKQVVAASRYYTFYTLDISAGLDYAALNVRSSAEANALLESRIPSPMERQAIVAYHRQERRLGGITYQPDDATLGGLVGKYWDALSAIEKLVAEIRRVRRERGFDLEFSMDERPPGIETCACITTNEEVVFVLLEAQRRGLPLTHLAPNFGVEKGLDYRCPGGLTALARRITTQYRIANEFDALLDFHSGDDLSQATRRVIALATSGRNHFKIAPQPQIMFAETVRDYYSDLFRTWWNESLAYAQREASYSKFAADCIREYQASPEASPSPTDSIFHNFGFSFVGKRDAQGQYVNREKLYGLSPEFYREYQDRLVQYYCGLAQDLFTV